MAANILRAQWLSDWGLTVIGSLIGFFELGAIILAWTIILNFLIKGVTAHHSDRPWAQGLAALYHA